MLVYIQMNNEEIENQSVLVESVYVWTSLLFLLFLLCKNDAH